MEKLYDLAIKNARVMRPNKTSVNCLDIAIKEGKIACLAPDIRVEPANEVFDAKNLLAFPGCVDAHMLSASMRRSPRTPFRKARRPRWAASPQA
jgi:dihydroorotase-like cyclic amidohydrolase